MPSFPFEKYIVDYDAFEQVDMNTAYYGFCEFGCNGLTEAKWAILKVEKQGDVFIRRWANGTKEKNLKFSERAAASQDYKFLI